MKFTILISILALLLQVGLAIPLVPNLVQDGPSVSKRDPRGGRGGGGLFGGLFGGGKGGSKGGSSPPKTTNKAGPSKATTSKIISSTTSSSVASSISTTSSSVVSSSSSTGSSSSSATITSTTSSQSSTVSGSSSLSSITSSGSTRSTSSGSSTVSSSTTTAALGRIAWPRPTMKGAHPPTFKVAKSAKVPSFPRTKPKTQGNSTLYTPEFIEDSGLPKDLQKRSAPHPNNNPNRAVPAGTECPDSTDDIRQAGFMKPVPQGEAMFYSGVDAGNTRGQTPPSKAFADQHNVRLLRDYVAQEALDKNIHQNDRKRVPNCAEWWTLASKYLAEEVSGNVAVLLPPLDPNNRDVATWPLAGVAPTAMWFTTEWEAVRDNPRVCSVWRFDVTGHAVKIHERPGCVGVAKPF